MNEKKRVDDASNWYLKEQLDFDRRLIGFRYKTLRPHFHGSSCLELGPAEGQMTRFLKNDFESLTVVDGASLLLDQIPNYPNLVKVHSLFEDFIPTAKYDTIIMEHILEHVDLPVDLMHRVRGWLAPEGKMLLGVPNANSIHRLAATKMGLLNQPCELNSRDLAQGHRRVYTWETFEKDIRLAGLEILELGGVYFKPLSNQQIQENWTEKMIEGFYELGKDFPEHAADIFAVCQV